MDIELLSIFSKGTDLLAMGLVAASLFFALITLREISTGHFETILFAAVTAFFLAVHIYLLVHSPRILISGDTNAEFLWQWIGVYMAPALVALFVAFGAIWLLATATRVGLIKLFFGLTLFCYIYLLGPNWPADIKAILTLVYSGAWFQVGLKTAV